MLLRSSAWPALRMATPLILVSLLLAVALIGPHGIAITDISALVSESQMIRLSLLLGWSLAYSPAFRHSFVAPGLDYLRWLPLPQWLAMLHFGFVLTVIHLPLPLVMISAGKPAQGIGLAAAGAGLSACLLPLPYAWRDRLPALVLLASLIASIALAHWLAMTALGLLCIGWQLPGAWRRAAEISHRPAGRRIVGGAFGALISCQLLRLGRSESALLVRCALVALLGAGVLRLLISANPATSSGDLLVPALVAVTPFLAALAIMLALALRRGRRELYWLLASTGFSERGLSLVCLLVITCLLVALATVYALMLSDGALPGLSFVGHGCFWSSLATVAAASRSEDAKLAMLFFLAALADMLVLGLGGAWSIPVELLLGLFVLALLLLRPPAEVLRRA